MDSKQFYDNVKKMRHYQTLSKRTFTQADISSAKRFEKIIDDEIKRVEEKRFEQPKLF